MSAAPARRFDLPAPDADTQPFWDACRNQKLLLKRCLECSAVHFYPRPFCPMCWSERVEWFEASGRGTLYTWSVVHQNDLPPFDERVPYVAAVVELAEGPKMMTNVVECDFDALAPEMELEVVFTPIADDVTIPQFRPIA